MSDKVISRTELLGRTKLLQKQIEKFTSCTMAPKTVKIAIVLSQTCTDTTLERRRTDVKMTLSAYGETNKQQTGR